MQLTSQISRSLRLLWTGYRPPLFSGVMCMITKAWFGVLLVSVLCATAVADSWVGRYNPVLIYSHDTNYLVRIEPSKPSVGNAHFAQAHFYVRSEKSDNYEKYQSVALENPIAPGDAVISNSGELVTFDNWGALGYEQVVVLYSKSGSVLASYDLSDLFSPAEIAKIPTTETSRWWRDRPRPTDIGDGEVWISLAKSEDVLVFKLSNGSFCRGSRDEGC